MSVKSSRMILSLSVIAALVALLLGVYFSQYIFQKKRNLEHFHGTLLNQPRAIKPFALDYKDNARFNHDSLKGHWTMVFFGFTRCGYLCPTAMAELGKMYRILEEKGVTPLPQVVMVTIDPDRDSLKGLNQYVKGFHPQFYGARGAKKSIHSMTQNLGIAYAKVALRGRDAQKDYDIEHTGTISLFNPQGNLIAFFTTPHNAANLAEDYQLLVS